MHAVPVRRPSMTVVRTAAPRAGTGPDDGRPAASRDVSAAALPADRLDLPGVDDGGDHAGSLGEVHQLRAPVRASRRVALLPVDAVGAERLARRLAVRAAGLDVHHAHAPRVARAIRTVRAGPAPAPRPLRGGRAGPG